MPKIDNQFVRFFFMGIQSDMYVGGEKVSYLKVLLVTILDEFAGVVGNQEYLRKVEGLKID